MLYILRLLKSKKKSKSWPSLLEDWKGHFNLIREGEGVTCGKKHVRGGEILIYGTHPVPAGSRRRSFPRPLRAAGYVAPQLDLLLPSMSVGCLVISLKVTTKNLTSSLSSHASLASSNLVLALCSNVVRIFVDLLGQFL